MTIEEVQLLFHNHEVLVSGRTAADLAFATRLFQTNVACEYWVSYVPRRKLSPVHWDVCSVFFDGESRIIGYKLECPD